MKVKFRIPGKSGFGMGDVVNINSKGDLNVKTLNGWRNVENKDIMAISPDQGIYTDPSTHLKQTPGYKKIPASKKIPKSKWTIKSGE